MKHLLTVLLLVLSFFLSGSRSMAQAPSLDGMKWLIGKWENQTPRGKMVEEWTRLNDSTFSGKSYMITTTDSVPLETIELRREGYAIFYIPTVKSQNNDQPVKFKLSSATGRSVIFENPSHDFPQKISYTLEDEKSLTAEISGTVNGQNRSRKFPMKRL